MGVENDVVGMIWTLIFGYIILPLIIFGVMIFQIAKEEFKDYCNKNENKYDKE